MKDSFFIPFLLPSLNDVIGEARTHYHKSNSTKKRIEKDIQWLIKDAGIEKVGEPFILHCKWIEKNKRRDPDNIIAGGKKYILDAMQKAGVIDGDGHKWVKGFEDEFSFDKENSGVRVTIKKMH